MLLLVNVLFYHFQVHLSDEEGMGIFAKLLWHAAYTQLDVPVPAPAPTAPDVPRPASPGPITPPRVIVRDSPPSSPPSDPYVWMEVVNGKKVIFAYSTCVFPLIFAKQFIVQIQKCSPCIHFNQIIVICHCRGSKLRIGSSARQKGAWFGIRFVVYCNINC